MTYKLTGTQIGDIKVLSLSRKVYEPKRKHWVTYWNCLCLCGKQFEAITSTLTSKIRARESCGCCEWHINHNESYVSWCAMKQRCDDPNRKDYHYYGGRGITYDPRWSKFTEFYKDMGDPPVDHKGERLSLDRKDVNGNYCKDNCKWSDRSEQGFNRQ